MGTDDILEQLGALERERREEEDATDDRWRALAYGDLDTEALAALEAEAEHDAEAALAQALFTPLDDAAVARIQQSVRGAGLPAVTTPADPEPPRKRWRALLVLGLPTILAAAVALFVLRPAPATGPPGFELSAMGADAPWRGAEAVAPPETARLSAGSSLTIRLKPSKGARDGIAVRGFVIAAGAAHALPVEPARLEDGTLAIRGPVQVVLGVTTPGEVIMVFTAGPPDLLPADAATAIARAAARPAEWPLFETRVVVTAEP